MQERRLFYSKTSVNGLQSKYFQLRQTVAAFNESPLTSLKKPALKIENFKS
jgi:hypothetical protein